MASLTCRKRPALPDRTSTSATPTGACVKAASNRCRLAASSSSCTSWAVMSVATTMSPLGPVGPGRTVTDRRTSRRPPSFVR